MPCPYRLQAQFERTQREFEILREAIVTWLQRRRAADCLEDGTYLGRHKTQLETIESVLLGAIDSIRAKLKNFGMTKLSLVSLADFTGDLYSECRQYDETNLWLRRIWEYYRERFDQRDTEPVGSLLRAADEIIWSCYRQVFEWVERWEPDKKQGPAPLPFIESEYSPVVMLSDRPLPARLARRGSMAELDTYLNSLPIPCVRLPTWCVEEPWWMVVLGHEIGHHVQHRLQLVRYFRDGLMQMAREQGLTNDDIDRWGKWGEEIFADVFSVAIIGPWMLWPIVEVEWSPAREMVRRKTDYPSPEIRLQLLMLAASRLGHDPAQALAGLGRSDLPKDAVRTEVLNGLKQDQKMVPKAVDVALGSLPGKLRNLSALCSPAQGAPFPQQEVVTWSELLQQPTTQVQQIWPQDLRTARLVACGSLLAWESFLRTSGGSVGQSDRLRLATNTKELLSRSGPRTIRGPMLPSGESPEKGAELAELVWKVIQDRDRENAG